MKKILYIIFACSLFLCVSLTSVSASETSHGGGGYTGGYNHWDLDDKVAYWALHQMTFFQSLGVGSDCNDVYKEYLMQCYPQYDTDGCVDFYHYLAKNISTDEKEENWVFSPQLINLCNYIYEEFNDSDLESATYTYRYAVNTNNIDPDGFPSYDCFQAWCKIVANNPDYVFFVKDKSWVNRGGHYGVVWVDCYKIEDIVNANLDLLSAPCNGYCSDWNFASGSTFLFAKTGEWFNFGGVNLDDDSKITDFSEHTHGLSGTVNFSLLQDCSGSFFDAPIFSNHGAFKCWKSLSDLKSNTGNPYTFSGVSSSTATNVPITIDITIPDNNDDSGGGSSGGGSGSSGSGIGTSGIISGISDLFTAIFDIIGAILSGLASLISQIVSAIQDILDLINNDVLCLFTEIFTFLPEDLIKAIFGVFTIGLLFSLIKILRG